MDLKYFTLSKWFSRYCPHPFVGLAYQGKDIVFRFVIEYSSSLRDFYRPQLGNRSIFYMRIFER